MTATRNPAVAGPRPDRCPSSGPLTFVTGNPGKVATLAAMLDPVAVVGTGLTIHEIQHVSVLEVARLKATDAFDQLHVPLFVEDGGLVFDGCGGFPGSLTKPVLEAIGVDRLVRVAGDLPCVAWFESAVVYIDDDGPVEFFGAITSGHVVTPRDVPLPPEAWSDIWRIYRPDGADDVLAALPAHTPGRTPSPDSGMAQFVRWVHHHHAAALGECCGDTGAHHHR